MDERYKGQRENTAMAVIQRKLGELPDDAARERVLTWVCGQNGGEYLPGDEVMAFREAQAVTGGAS